MVIYRHKVVEVATRIKHRFRDRVLEWEHAVITILWGLVILANPAAFEGPGYIAFAQLGPAFWGWFVFIAGIVRISALCVNGYMAKPSAVIRAFAAITGILLFAAISLGFFFSWRWSTPLAVYPVVGFFGLFSLYWAIFDVATPEGHDGGTTTSS